MPSQQGSETPRFTSSDEQDSFARAADTDPPTETEQSVDKAALASSVEVTRSAYDSLLLTLNGGRWTNATHEIELARAEGENVAESLERGLSAVDQSGSETEGIVQDTLRFMYCIWDLF